VDDSLEAQYAAVIGTILEYSRLERSIFRRIYWRLVFYPKGLDVFFPTRWIWREYLGSRRHDEQMLAVIERIATVQERGHPLYDVVRSEFPMEALTLRLSALVPAARFGQIAELYTLRTQQKPWWRRPKLIFGGVVALGVFLVSNVPPGLLRRNGIDPELFREMVFAVTLQTLGTTGVFFLIYWYLLGRFRDLERRSIHEAIHYIAIRMKGGVAEQPHTGVGERAAASKDRS